MQSCIASWKAMNVNVIDQMNHIGDSLSKTHDMTIKKDLPIIFFTTNENDLEPHEDRKTHSSFFETYITNPTIQKVVALDGHHYLHLSCVEEMVRYIGECIK